MITAYISKICRKIVACKASVKKILRARTDAGSSQLMKQSTCSCLSESWGRHHFVEASLDMQMVREHVEGPLLANMTEFGITPETSMKNGQNWALNGYILVSVACCRRHDERFTKACYKTVQHHNSKSK